MSQKQIQAQAIVRAATIMLEELGLDEHVVACHDFLMKVANRVNAGEGFEGK